MRTLVTFRSSAFNTGQDRDHSSTRETLETIWPGGSSSGSALEEQ